MWPSPPSERLGPTQVWWPDRSQAPRWSCDHTSPPNSSPSSGSPVATERRSMRTRPSTNSKSAVPGCGGTAAFSVDPRTSRARRRPDRSGGRGSLQRPGGNGRRGDHRSPGGQRGGFDDDAVRTVSGNATALRFHDHSLSSTDRGGARASVPTSPPSHYSHKRPRGLTSRAPSTLSVSGVGGASVPNQACLRRVVSLTTRAVSTACSAAVLRLDEAGPPSELGIPTAARWLDGTARCPYS